MADRRPFKILIRNVAEATDEELTRAVREHFAPQMSALRAAFDARIAEQEQRAVMALRQASGPPDCVIIIHELISLDGHKMEPKEPTNG
jgi:hypothetical protein